MEKGLRGGVGRGEGGGGKVQFQESCLRIPLMARQLSNDDFVISMI